MGKIVLVIIIAALIAAFLYLENNLIDITRYRFKSENVISKIKIVQLSDLHSRPFKKVLTKTRDLKPDIIFVTGDFINDKCKKKEEMLSYAKELCDIAPVYYITGNHERRLENFNEIMSELKEAGFNVLLNKADSIVINETTISVLGLDENQADFEDYKARKKGTFAYRDMSAYFKEFSYYDGYKIVLSHYPENFCGIEEMNYSQYDFDLQLSGHAHGGQFILPFFGPVFSPGQGIHPKYARGSFGERPKLIISRGLANSEFPFRLFNHPEINVITVSKLLASSK